MTHRPAGLFHLTSDWMIAMKAKQTYTAEEMETLRDRLVKRRREVANAIRRDIVFEGLCLDTAIAVRDNANQLVTIEVALAGFPDLIFLARRTGARRLPFKPGECGL
jgi:hypothetical protein